MNQITSAVSILTLGALLGTLGCSSSNNPATSQNPAGGSDATGGQTSTDATGGSTSATTTQASTGGSSSTAAPTGGSSSTASTGGATAGGTTSTSTSTSGTCENTQYTPMCGTTTAGTAIAKAVACTAADPQLCYKTCGPQSIGFKSETCTNGAYAEEPSGPPCHFNTGAGCDYSCYKVPTANPTQCPATAPQHNQPCTIDPCIVCGMATGYLDSSGNQKTGFCVCVAATATTTQKWSCATYPSAWPCGTVNNGPGCT